MFTASYIAAYISYLTRSDDQFADTVDIDSILLGDAVGWEAHITKHTLLTEEESRYSEYAKAIFEAWACRDFVYCAFATFHVVKSP